jgi:predicted RNase H-like HicB family nuclease
MIEFRCVEVEYPELGVWVVSSMEHPGLFGVGRTPEEADEDLSECLLDALWAFLGLDPR